MLLKGKLEDLRQRMIDFEGIDLLPEEKELAEAAKADIETFKERRVKERVKRKSIARSYAGASLLAELMIRTFLTRREPGCERHTLIPLWLSLKNGW